MTASDFFGIDFDEDDVERAHRFGPDDAVCVVILLDGGADDSGHADAVAAHRHHPFLAFLVEDDRMHAAAVLVPQLEDVADLDASRDRQGAAAAGTRIPSFDVAQIEGDGHGRSRSQFTPVRWVSAAFAPQTKSASTSAL